MNVHDLQHARRMNRVLRRVNQLIAPLSSVSKPRELLILCPTGPIHGLPLHAIPIEGSILLERNPVVYSASLSVYQIYRARADLPRECRPAIFGDPTGDRQYGTSSASEVAALLGSEAILGHAVTVDAFRRHAQLSNLIHYHGHALFDQTEPLKSAIKLADGDFTASDALELGLPPSDVTMIACGSGSQIVARGDEPIGLVPALLVAGVTSVLATFCLSMMTTVLSSARCIIRTFRRARSLILHKAALAISKSGTEAPYHWASFVLHGCWERNTQVNAEGDLQPLQAEIE